MKIEIPGKDFDGRHLGDVISIIQNNLDADFFYAHSSCLCCGNDCRECAKQVLDLLGMHHKLTDDAMGAVKGRETWENKSWDHSVYMKAIKKSKKENYLAYQFDVRSSYRKRPPQKEIDSFLSQFKGSLIDVGESSKLNIKEKFDVVDRAFCYVGADSGITHLALMSTTPIIVMQNEEHPRQLFYPYSNQIKFLNNHIDVLEHIKSLKIKHM